MASVSFEYFPPRSKDSETLLDQTIQILSEFQPQFQSVTYGAGGSNKGGTFGALRSIQKSTLLPVASHLTYTGSDTVEIEEFADELWNAGIQRVVALRGDDRLSKNESDPFGSTAEFVKSLKDQHPFEVAVACYPETHPRATSRQDDLRVLKAKQDAGATAAITQFFFDNSAFYEFVKEARAAGITIPIIPGILPIYNFEKIKKMAAECGTSIPDFVHEAFGDQACAGSCKLEIASELLKAQVHDLACAGYETIHIYTLNRAPLAKVAASEFLAAHSVVRDTADLRKAS